ncbi:protein kinase domain-containing protein [Aquisphaera insulae]|uniref:protein kinase domain-containing protein n=1 Tax=Aquisphaera insulae TaxID=2712864 RepID=UPI0013ECEECF|nr:protein kinase [Aquisphaera insulae]
MATDLRVSELLEELHDTGRTPEEVCSDFPELLPEVRDRWRRVRRLEAELDSWFPPERESPSREASTAEGPPDLPAVAGYELEALLGRGGMGVVFRARHVRLNRPVAIKMAIAGAYASPRERDRFQREAEAVAALRHPHVVQIYDVGDAEGRPYYAMEFVAGGSLAAREKPTGPREAAALVLTLAGAMQAAHAAGIIHRDLKPANILLETDGTPKVGDFGLSCRIDDASGLTLNGAVIGTPNYMAPEQAAGDPDGVGPAVDIYALGGILYELLTGQPPFRGKTPAETIRQVVAQDPAPPTSLNPKVPRDLEIICLKCLSKDPALRYASAERLGADLRRFLDGEAIEAKAEGRAARVWRRVRRSPGWYAMFGGVLLLAGALAGAGLWIVVDRAEAARRAAVEVADDEHAARDDLREMARAMERAGWAEARAAFGRAEGRLSGRGTGEIHAAVERARRDLELVARLDAVRMNRARSIGGSFDDAGADEAYAREFRRFGFGGPEEAPEVVAARVARSDARYAVLDALDDWPVSRADAGRKAWALHVARLVVGQDAGWIGDARDPELRRGRGSLERLVATAPVADQPVPLLLAIAGDLRAAGGDSLDFLEKIQRARPGDFWANLALGSALNRAGRHAEAIRYHQSALSLRPDTAVSCNNLGSSLTACGRPGEAIEYFRASLRIDPTAAIPIYNLAYNLRHTGRLDESIALLRSAAERDPDSALLHAGFGDSLAAASRAEEAMGEYRRAIELDPRLLIAQPTLRTTFLRLLPPEEARATWRKAIDAAPDTILARDGYAEFCLFLGHEGDYREERNALLERFGRVDEPQAAERIGRACLLLPLPPAEAERAVALIERALAGRPSPPPVWTRPYFLLARALGEYRRGRFSEAVPLLDGEAATVLGPCPLLIKAMAQKRLGQDDAALRSLTAAVRGHDWDLARADNREAWIYHILRREAEATIRGHGSGGDGLDRKGDAAQP